jgi:hypothetical protein
MMPILGINIKKAHGRTILHTPRLRKFAPRSTKLLSLFLFLFLNLHCLNSEVKRTNSRAAKLSRSLCLSSYSLLGTRQDLTRCRPIGIASTDDRDICCT